MRLATFVALSHSLCAQLQECFRSNVIKYKRFSSHYQSWPCAIDKTQSCDNNKPQIYEVAVLIVWLRQEFTKKDIVLRAWDNTLKWVSDIHLQWINSYRLQVRDNYVRYHLPRYEKLFSHIYTLKFNQSGFLSSNHHSCSGLNFSIILTLFFSYFFLFLFVIYTYTNVWFFF